MTVLKSKRESLCKIGDGYYSCNFEFRFFDDCVHFEHLDKRHIPGVCKFFRSVVDTNTMKLRCICSCLEAAAAAELENL